MILGGVQYWSVRFVTDWSLWVDCRWVAPTLRRMPVEFLSDEQATAYGSFAEVPSLSDLEKFFFLDAFDRDVIARSRADSHRLGVAVQLRTVRYKGLFLEDPLDVPWPVVDHLAEQLGIGDPSAVKRYTERPKTAYEHARMIRDAYGFVSFGGREGWEARQLNKGFLAFLHGRAWTHAEGPGRCLRCRWRGCAGTGSCCRVCGCWSGWWPVCVSRPTSVCMRWWPGRRYGRGGPAGPVGAAAGGAAR